MADRYALPEDDIDILRRLAERQVEIAREVVDEGHNRRDNRRHNRRDNQ